MSRGFVMFGPSHWAMLAVFALGVWGVLAQGRRDRADPDRARRRGHLYAALVLTLVLVHQLTQIVPTFDVQTGLPFSLCTIASLVVGLALWTRRPALVALAYYWGIGLSTQALVTPDLREPFPQLAFFVFWAGHFLIVWSAVYLVWGLGIRPTWHGYRLTVLVTFVWLVAVFVSNLWLGTNYGFVNRKPPEHTLLDLAGPWPWYVVVEIVVVAAVWALMTWPWERRHRLRAGGR